MSKVEVNPGADKNILPASIEDEMRSSYLDYSMSVIVGRALPDVRDGLKPVHRRILYAMHDLGLKHSKPYKKSARIVGAVLGQYHPHGDSAVYDALVRMAQDFSLRYPLVEGQGNFGSVDGDSAAQMRYTEARLEKLSQELLEDIDQDSVDFVDNFDGSMQEPSLLPCKFPNLLVNGSTGIAVGMATNIPPHNIRETCEGVITLIDNPDADVHDLMEDIKGPDFPTGGILMNTSGLKKAYTTGRGKVTISSKIEVEETDRKTRLIATEIPYMVNKSSLLEQVARLVRTEKLDGISELRDESDRNGMRIVIALKRDAQPEIVKNKILKYTRFQETFGIILLGLVDNQPKVLSLKQCLEEFLAHRKSVVRRRLTYELTKAEERIHILDGLLIALNQIDEVIETIKASENRSAAQDALMETYNLTEEQSRAVLNMRLSQLAKLESDEIRGEHDELSTRIEEIREILADEQKVLDIIKEELQYIIDEYGDERLTEISDHEEGTIELEDLIKDENVVVTLSESGYVKRIPLETYRTQARGGVGIIGSETKSDDALRDIFVTHNKAHFLVFTDAGQVYWMKAYQIPKSGRYSRGKPIINILDIETTERINAIIHCDTLEEEAELVFATKNGYVKKTRLNAYSNPRRGGIRAIRLEDDDGLVRVVKTDGEDELLIGTKKGQAIRFKETDVRSMGRATRGVIGIRLAGNDEVVDIIKANPGTDVLTLSENGYGKRTPITEYRLINRGGKGVMNLKHTKKTGDVVAVRAVQGDEEIMLISKEGMVIRTAVDQISQIGRATQGVRVIRLKDNDTLRSVAKVDDDSLIREDQEGNEEN